MLGLAAAWFQKSRRNSDDDKPSGPRVERVVGVAGRIANVPVEAANDLMVPLIVFLLVLVLNYAKNRAKISAFRAFSAKLTGRNFFPAGPL